ncbi:hypothetical protein AB0M41_13955 [Streptomyces sp. NPDC051896]
MPRRGVRGASSSLCHRADLFKKYGLKVLATLDESARSPER